jgi:hypothetical protein
MEGNRRIDLSFFYSCQGKVMSFVLKMIILFCLILVPQPVVSSKKSTSVQGWTGHSGNVMLDAEAFTISHT